MQDFSKIKIETGPTKISRTATRRGHATKLLMSMKPGESFVLPPDYKTGHPLQSAQQRLHISKAGRWEVGFDEAQTKRMWRMK